LNSAPSDTSIRNVNTSTTGKGRAFHVGNPRRMIMTSKYSMPEPKFRVGDKVLYYPRKSSGIPGYQSDKDFYLKNYLHHLIRKHRKIVNVNGPFTKHVKSHIKGCMEQLKKAHGTIVEIAGVIPKYGHNIDANAFNACYLSGEFNLDYGYHISVSWSNSKGDVLALVTGISVGGNNSFKTLGEAERENLLPKVQD
jgi:hypothetical protein